MDSYRRDPKQPKSQYQHYFIPWDSKMVAEVDILCRSRIPFIPDIVIPDSELHSISEYEYDFILEHQTVADYEQYWEQKQRMETLVEKPDISADTSVAVPNVPLNSVTTTSLDQKMADPIATQPPSARCPSNMSSPDPVGLGTTLNFPPIAARHLRSDQILQPHRTQTVPNASELSSPSEPIIVKDFETGSDDPFASTELKTINDIEELQNLLSIMPGSINAKTNSVSNKPASQVSLPTTTFSLKRSLPSSDSSSVPLGHQSISLSSATKPVVRLSTTMPGSSHYQLAIPQPVPCASASTVSTANVQLPLNGLTTTSGRTLSSSVPNFEATGLTGRPSSVAGVTISTVPFVPGKSVQTSDAGFQLMAGAPRHPLGFSQPITRTPKELDSFIQSLLDWAKFAGLLEPRARSLLMVPQNKSRFSQLTFEKAKQLLSEQLNMVHLLLTEHSTTNGYTPPLSEQTAVVAVSAFSFDLLKARQFAKVALDLEKCGYPQEVAQSYLLNSKLDSDATLAQFLTALPRPGAAFGHASWQSASLTRPHRKS